MDRVAEIMDVVKSYGDTMQALGHYPDSHFLDYPDALDDMTAAYGAVEAALTALTAERDAAVQRAEATEKVVQAAVPVRDSFKAVGADKNGLVKWSVNPTAMKALIVALYDAGKGGWDAR